MYIGLKEVNVAQDHRLNKSVWFSIKTGHSKSFILDTKVRSYYTANVVMHVCVHMLVSTPEDINKLVV